MILLYRSKLSSWTTSYLYLFYSSFYTHTHTRLMVLFLGLPGWAGYLFVRYQKGKTNLDFTEARDSEWQWHQLDHMRVCTSLQTDYHASMSSLNFYRPDFLPAAKPTASKHWRQFYSSFLVIWSLVFIGNYFMFFIPIFHPSSSILWLIFGT